MADPAGLVVFDGTLISSSSAALSAAIISQRPSAAVMILELRFDTSSQQWVMAAKAYNRNFLELTDARPFKSGNLSDVFIRNPVFLNPSTMKVHAVGIQRCWAISEAFLHRQTSYGALFTFHVTHAGRCRKVLKEFISAQTSPMCAEFIMCETVLPEDVSFTTDLHKPHSFGPIIRTQGDQWPSDAELRRDAAIAPPFKTALAAHLVDVEMAGSEVDAEDDLPKTRSHPKKRDTRFTCAQCGTRSTAQRRYGVVIKTCPPPARPRISASRRRAERSLTSVTHAVHPQARA